MLEQSPGNFGNSKVPYDWYQTQTHVIITIRIANLKENDVKVTIINDALDVMCQLMDGRQFRMHFNLYKTVIVPDSNWAVDTSKLVINLRKADRKRWHSLETIPDKLGNKPKSFIGIVSLHDAKTELNNLLSAAEFESKENSTNAITITQSRVSTSANEPEEPISLDYNWYQDDKYINIVIHVPNINMPDNRCFLFYEDDINIILTDNSLNWICNLPTGVTNVTFKLYKEINSNESRYEISPCRSKIEIKLRKLEDSYWPSFVVTDLDQQQEQSPPTQQRTKPHEQTMTELTAEGSRTVTVNSSSSSSSMSIINNNTTFEISQPIEDQEAGEQQPSHNEDDSCDLIQAKRIKLENGDQNLEQVANKNDENTLTENKLDDVSLAELTTTENGEK